MSNFSPELLARAHAELARHGLPLSSTQPRYSLLRRGIETDVLPWCQDHQVGAIVTRADLQKAPVRLFLFGMITLIEMHFLRIIRDRFEDDSWKSKARDYVDEAERVFLSRRNRN